MPCVPPWLPLLLLILSDFATLQPACSHGGTVAPLSTSFLTRHGRFGFKIYRELPTKTEAASSEIMRNTLHTLRLVKRSALFNSLKYVLYRAASTHIGAAYSVIDLQTDASSTHFPWLGSSILGIILGGWSHTLDALHSACLRCSLKQSLWSIMTLIYLMYSWFNGVPHTMMKTHSIFFLLLNSTTAVLYSPSCTL